METKGSPSPIDALPRPDSHGAIVVWAGKTKATPGIKLANAQPSFHHLLIGSEQPGGLEFQKHSPEGGTKLLCPSLETNTLSKDGTDTHLGMCQNRVLPKHSFPLSFPFTPAPNWYPRKTQTFSPLEVPL